jgi:hypothetical protein
VGNIGDRVERKDLVMLNSGSILWGEPGSGGADLRFCRVVFIDFAELG